MSYDYEQYLLQVSLFAFQIKAGLAAAVFWNEWRMNSGTAEAWLEKVDEAVEMIDVAELSGPAEDETVTRILADVFEYLQGKAHAFGFTTVKEWYDRTKGVLSDVRFLHDNGLVPLLLDIDVDVIINFLAEYDTALDGLMAGVKEVIDSGTYTSPALNDDDTSSYN